MALRLRVVLLVAVCVWLGALLGVYWIAGAEVLR